MIEERFNQLLDEAQEAFAGGDLEGAVSLFEQAEALARDAGEVDLADRAYGNAAFVRLNELGLAEQEIPGLRRLFLRSASSRNRWSACYSLAVAYDLIAEPGKALEWAARSSEIAAQIGEPKISNRGNSLSAVLALKASRLEEAKQYLDTCLHGTWDIESEVERVNLAHVKANMGYVLCCLGQTEDGLEFSRKALSELEQEDASHVLYQTHQDLCFGYLLADELETAHRHGEKALQMAEDYSDLQVMKNCLFLLAETAVRRGDTFRARRYLRELTNFYPEIEMNEEIIDVFLATDLTNVVNLRG